LSVSALIPETTLEEGSGSDIEVDNRQMGEASPPNAADVEKAPVEFKCPDCDLSFNLKIRLNRHLKLHDKKNQGSPMLKIVKTESGTPGKVRAPPRNYIEPKEGTGHPCGDCGKRFNSKNAMMRHFEDIHQPGEYPCRGCGRIFSSKNKCSSHYSRNCKNRTRTSI